MFFPTYVGGCVGCILRGELAGSKGKYVFLVDTADSSSCGVICFWASFKGKKLYDLLPFLPILTPTKSNLGSTQNFKMQILCQPIFNLCQR